MNLPIETVVDLLMANYQENGECGHESDMWIDLPSGATISDATSKRLRTKVREYLLTLVPKPKLLSECEEYKNVTTQGETIVYRVGKDVYRSVDNTWVGYADQVRVIQPVEVQR
jgi:hypothetical protein